MKISEYLGATLKHVPRRLLLNHIKSATARLLGYFESQVWKQDLKQQGNNNATVEITKWLRIRNGPGAEPEWDIIDREWVRQRDRGRYDQLRDEGANWVQFRAVAEFERQRRSCNSWVYSEQLRQILIRQFYEGLKYRRIVVIQVDVLVVL